MRNREVRFALKNGLHEVSRSGPESANRAILPNVSISAFAYLLDYSVSPR